MSEETDIPKGASLLAWAALVVVYVVWGSTYLAIRVAVRDLPPMTLAGLRYVSAGLLLFPFALRSGGGRRPSGQRLTPQQVLAAAVVGFLLLVLGNGGLCIGEQTLDSGFAAVLVSTVPLWMVVFAVAINGTSPTASTLVSLALGLGGVIVLVGAGSASGHLPGVLVVLGASAAWGLGSVLSHRLPLPGRAQLAAALEMLAGGVILLVIAAVTAELGQVRWSHVPADAWVATLYLIVPGSVLAFTAYGYALARLPLATVSTYAYVNPVVALLLGQLILSETLTVRGIIGSLLVVISVALAVRRPVPRPTRRSSGRLPVSEVAGSALSSRRSTSGPSTHC